ncbi:hypothetical protein AB0C59_19900 [Streptomyces sp. NPDC048664]|uniref:hypothetical protein n=1 Tax=Streptomyces sp. NPDC048664 TaxID=3154505 RepID=UPI00343BB380
MKAKTPGDDTWIYSHTPSQAEGEREEPPGSRTVQHPDVPRTEPSQAEGERLEDPWDTRGPSQ